jgi:Regulator of chromosome condensation (RCC1) repeat
MSRLNARDGCYLLSLGVNPQNSSFLLLYLVLHTMQACHNLSRALAFSSIVVSVVAIPAHGLLSSCLISSMLPAHHKVIAQLCCRGRNAEGQCGNGDTPLVVEPAQLDLLAGSDVSTLAAGSLHSAAVLQDGSVLTWGSGKAGKLGHGVGDNFARPCRHADCAWKDVDPVAGWQQGGDCQCSPLLCRVEALVGRANVAQAALGTSHSLFLDGSGAVWSCGENKEVGTTSKCANVLVGMYTSLSWRWKAGQTTWCTAYAAGKLERHHIRL